jgi:hypothetical protein
MVQAVLAANDPEGWCAKGPSIRSDQTGDLGDLGIGDPFASVRVDDRAGVAHRLVRLVADGGDRGVDGRVAGNREREHGAGLDDRGHRLAGAVRRIGAHQNALGARPGGDGRVDRLGNHAGRAP